MNKSKPFIPSDKPKSFVLGTIAGLCGLAIACPILIGGTYFKIGFLKSIGAILFVIFWAVSAIMWVVFMVQMLTGKYRNIQEADWNEQKW